MNSCTRIEEMEILADKCHHFHTVFRRMESAKKEKEANFKATPARLLQKKRVIKGKFLVQFITYYV